MTAALDAALALAGSGRPVFPINANKRPLTGSGFHDASRDPAVLRSWFAKNPDAGLAVPMGAASGLWCLDVDAEKVNPVTGEVTPSGEVALAALVDRYGPLPVTLEQRTGGGGRQLFFRWEPGLRVLSRTGDIAPGLDTRGAKPDGQATGYCALPPSGHYTGGRYVWTNPIGAAVPDFNLAALAPPWLLFLVGFDRSNREALAALGITGAEGFDDLPPAEWPDWAAQLLADAEAKRAAGAANGAERPAEGNGGAREHYARAAIEQELADLAATAPGSQDVEMNNAAVRVWSLIKGAGLEGEASTFRSLFLDACRQLPNQAGRPRWTERDFSTKWDRARDAARPRDLSDVAEGWSFGNSAFGRSGDSAHAGAGEEGKAGGAGGAKPSAAPGECLPLFPPLPPAEPYPVEALGPLGSAAAALARKVQVPPAMAAQSVLAAAALAAQAHADVVTPFGQTRPLSLFLVTVAASGDRKSTADGEALWPVRKRERALREGYEEELKDYRVEQAAWAGERRKIMESRALDVQGRRDALRQLGDEPDPPLHPFLTAPSPTLEGLVKEWLKAHPALGLFTDEGGQFTGGHAMSDERRLSSAADMSKLWDGATIVRVRALDGASVLPGRRLSAHLMIQAEAAAAFLSNPTLRDQGLLSRFLVAAPDSLAGSRLYRDTAPADDAALRSYGARLLSLLEAPPTMAEGKRNELAPRALPLSADAAAEWRAFADLVERQLGADGPLRPVRDFAAKAAEHAARIAGVLTLYGDLRAEEIGVEAFADAAVLMSWYLGEALRLQAAGRTDPGLIQAQRLLDFLRGRAGERGEVGFREVLQHGPLRIKAALEAALKVLADHGWVEDVTARPRVVRVWPGSEGDTR